MLISSVLVVGSPFVPGTLLQASFCILSLFHGEENLEQLLAVVPCGLMSKKHSF